MWPPAALDFLRELESNNDRDWFKANRSRYEQSLVAPARELADQLTHLGQPRFFRPYNNLRYRPGPPIKEHLAVAIEAFQQRLEIALRQRGRPMPVHIVRVERKEGVNVGIDPALKAVPI